MLHRHTISHSPGFGRHSPSPGIKLNKNTSVTMLLFADHMLFVHESEDSLQQIFINFVSLKKIFKQYLKNIFIAYLHNTYCKNKNNGFSREASDAV